MNVEQKSPLNRKAAWQIVRMVTSIGPEAAVAQEARARRLLAFGDGQGQGEKHKSPGILRFEGLLRAFATLLNSWLVGADGLEQVAQTLINSQSADSFFFMYQQKYQHIKLLLLGNDFLHGAHFITNSPKRHGSP